MATSNPSTLSWTLPVTFSTGCFAFFAKFNGNTSYPSINTYCDSNTFTVYFASTDNSGGTLVMIAIGK
jgi:hypothetical protein